MSIKFNKRKYVRKGAIAGANVCVVMMCIAVLASSPYLYLPARYFLQHFADLIPEQLKAFNGVYMLIILNALFYIGVGAGAGYVVGLREQSKMKRRYPYCSRCGYDLTGNESGTCPECGTTIQS